VDRVVDAVPSAHAFGEADGAGDRGGWVIGQAEGEGQEEQRLGVGRSFDLRVERLVHRHQEIALDLVESGERSVVHPQPPAIAERVAVAALHRCSARGPDVGEQQRCVDLRGDLAQIRSFQAGWVPLKTAGADSSPVRYHPMPKPSPLVVTPPSRACRLWSMIECSGRNSSSSARIGSPE
jgi:hypothetical protein